MGDNHNIGSVKRLKKNSKIVSHNVQGPTRARRKENMFQRIVMPLYKSSMGFSSLEDFILAWSFNVVVGVLANFLVVLSIKLGLST